MRVVLAGLLALLLAACASGGGQIYYTHYGSYSRSIAQYAARDGEMALAVFGNPTAADPAIFNAAVADGLAGTHVSHDTVFVPTDPPQTRGYRTVAVFGGTTMQAICGQNPAAPGSAAAGKPGRFAAAFCYDGRVLSFVEGEHRALEGPHDPALQSLLWYVGHELFPQENPEDRRGEDGDFVSRLMMNR